MADPVIPVTDLSRFTQLGILQDIFRWVTDTEYQWMLHGDKDGIHTPWMPFQPADFIAILAECAGEVNGPAFLDVGCGPGTKLALAQFFFGFDVTGVERDEVMADAARERKFTVWGGDALDYPNYGDKDLVWLYKPFKDPALENELEQRIYQQVKSGAIVAGGQLETHPPGSWAPIIDDWDLRRGAWRKP